MNLPTYVEVELQRAERLVRKDKRHRWVTMDGHIHEKPVPYREAISVRWSPIVALVVIAWREAALVHPAV